MSASLHEECGVFGLCAAGTEDAASIAYHALYALQHRGQEACGIATINDRELSFHKDLGLVGEVFDEKTSIFNPFTVEDFTSFQSDQKAAMEEKALSRGLLAEARAKAVSSVEQLFAAALPDTYTVTVQ